MKNVTLKLYLLLFYCCSVITTKDVLEDVRSLLIADLQKYFQSGCIYLLYSRENDVEDLHWKLFLSRVQINLWRKSVATATLSSTSLLEIAALTDCRRNRTLFVILFKDEDMQTVLQKIFSSIHPANARWLLFMNNSSPGNVADFLRVVNIPFDCEFLVAAQSQDGLELSEAYKVKEDFPLRVSLWGYWNLRDGLWPPKLSLYQRRHNLEGITLIAPATQDPPLQTMIENVDGTIEADGLFPMLMQQLARELNFSLVLIKPEDSGGGVKRKDGTWTGLVGMLQRRECNITATSLYMYSARMEAVDYTIPIVVTKAFAFIRTPDGSDDDWNIYTSPYRVTAWLAICGTVLIIACYLSVFNILVYRNNFQKLSEALFCLWGSFCSQGYSCKPEKRSSRLLHWTVLFTAMTISMLYSANFTSFLAVRKVKLPFTSLQGVLDDPGYEFGVLRGGGLYTNFQSANDSVMRELYARKILPNNDTLPRNVLSGLHRVCEEQFVFMETLDFLWGFADELQCDVSILPSTAFPIYIALAVTKNNPYRGIINFMLRAMTKSGLVRRMILLKWPQPREVGNMKTLRSVEVNEVLPLMSAWVAGLILCILVLLLEICVGRKMYMK